MDCQKWQTQKKKSGKSKTELIKKEWHDTRNKTHFCEDVQISLFCIILALFKIPFIPASNEVHGLDWILEFSLANLTIISNI